MKKNFLSICLIFCVWAGFSLNSANPEHQILFNHIVEKMKDGGRLHLILPDIDSLLNKPNLPDDIRNYACILGAYINYRKGDYNAANSYFNSVKFTGKILDIQDYIYHWWGKTSWSLYKINKDPVALKRAQSCFKKTADFPVSPMKRKAFIEYIKTLYYSNDYSFLNFIPSDFLNEKTGVDKSELPEILFILGSTYQKMGNRGKSDDLFLQLRKKFPYSYWAEKIPNEVQFPSISTEELLDIYDRCYEKKKSKPYLKSLLEKLDKIRPEMRGLLKSKMNLLYGKINLSLDSKISRKKSLAFLSSAYRSSSPEIKTQAAYYLVKSMVDDFKFTRIKQIAASLNTSRYMKSEYFERTAYAAGYPFMRKQKFKEALFFYKMILKKEAPGNQYYEQALWRLHWCYYHLGKYDDALKILDKMSKFDNWSEYAPFWTAYILRKKGAADSAKNIYKKILADAGFTYYGMQSKDILKKDFGVDIALDAGKEKFKELKIDPITDSARDSRYRFLTEIGLYEFAALELETYAKEKNISFYSDSLSWTPYGSELAKLYFYSGKYLKSDVYLYRAYHNYISNGATEIPQWFRDIYYPLFYKDTIDTFSKLYGLDPTLIYSLIRQESVFEPFIVSPSGAIGVMQIMPETGKMIFKHINSSLNLDYYSSRILYIPEVNIPMGIYHLRRQLYDRIENFIKEKGITAADNDFMKTILMIAGYNAGVERSFQWITDIPFDNEQEFIDQIDYSETRRYVKLILKHRYFYRQKITSTDYTDLHGY